MQIISRTVFQDADTFAPVMQLVINLPIEPMMDGLAATGPEEFATIVGKELLKQLQELTHQLNKDYE